MEISIYLVVKWYLLLVVLRRFAVKLQVFLSVPFNYEVVSIK